MSFTAVMSGSGALAVSEFHLCTVSSESPHRITNQWTGFVVTSPQTSHLNSCSVVMSFSPAYHWSVMLTS
jgi:hypothetical protein